MARDRLQQVMERSIPVKGVNKGVIHLKNNKLGNKAGNEQCKIEQRYSRKTQGDQTKG